MNKPILAFMQNMWLKNPDAFWEKFHRLRNTRGPEFAEGFRLNFIRLALFWNCPTGKRLKATFGEKLIDQIIWEESTRDIGSTARQVFPANLTHMRQVIELHQPRIIVTFGKVAGDALAAVWQGATERCVHPTARGSHVLSELLMTAGRLKDHISLCK